MVTIGCHPVVASYSLPAALKSLSRTAPDYRIDLKHDLSRSVLLEIQQGRVDIGLVVNATPTPDLIVRKIASDDVCVWTSPRASVSSQTSAKHDRIFCDPSLMQTQSILRKWKKAPTVQIATSSLELIVRLTAEGLGYGILPARAVKLVGAKLQVEPHLPSYRDTISLVYRPEFGKNKIERRVIEALTASLE